MNLNAGKNWGYQPTLSRKIVRRICKFFIIFFRLNGRTKFSNEFIQMLDPRFTTNFDGRKLVFRTGNGRLLWRAKTLTTEEPLMNSWIKSVQSTDVVLDVGANVGVYTLPIAQKAKMVYACELDPLNVAILKENVVLNSLQDRVMIIPVACGESIAFVDIKFRALAYGDALQSIAGGDVLDSYLGKLPHSMKSLQMPLDGLFAATGATRPNKIKIDVDGNEETVLKGMSSLLATASEVYFEDSFTMACRNFMNSLNEMGYQEIEQYEIFSKDGKFRSLGFNRIFTKSS